MENFKNIKWLYLARLASLIGSQVLFFTVPLLVFKLTHSVVYSGIVFSLEWLARVISFPLSGLSADKFGSKRVYILTDSIIGILCGISILLISNFNGITFVVLVVLAVSAGFLSEQGYVSAESLAPKLVTEEYYPKSQSILESMELLALLFGPFFAGVFILFFTIKSLIWVAMIFYLFSAFIMRKITIDENKNSNKVAFNENLLSGFKVIFKHDYLISLVILSMLANILFGLMTGSAPVMVVGVYEKPDQFYAILNLTSGMVGIVFIIFLNHFLRFISIVHIGVATFLISCLSCILVGFFHSYLSYLFLYALFFGANGLFSIFFRSERARVIPKDVLGRSIGAIIFITFLLFPLSGLLIGLSKELFGLTNLIMILGVICFFLGIPLILRIYRLSSY